jgi:NAD(P) transhydrogenase subunit alpha
MRIGVPREPDREHRVALTPQAVARLGDHHDVVVETGAGARAGFSDDDYRSAGANVTDRAIGDADVVLVVGPPAPEIADRIARGSALLGFLDPFVSPDLVNALVAAGVSAFAVEAIPRTTLAQSMDALSSQASAAGYHAVLLAASRTPRIFPMMITAAGTVPPVKLLVLGAGVAGLQAIATSKRLGAVTSAYDIRPAVREQIESLGARFIAAPVDESAASSSGYATEVADETQRRQQQELAPHVAASDVVITTAQIPGGTAPLLVTKEMVDQMRPGSVIVDMAAASGGNCELSRPDEEVDHGGVLILGPTDLASRVAVDASEMYARNLSAFLERLTDDDGGLVVDLDDEIVGGSCITHGGEIVHPTVRRALGVEEPS